jgi:hypothetical protein
MSDRLGQFGESLGPTEKTGKVCSLHFRPRRWFGQRLERILGDFLASDAVHLAGLREATLDLLAGVVRKQGDDRVLLSAHHLPESGVVRAKVTVFYSVPTDEPEQVAAILGWLGRKEAVHSYYRLGTKVGAWPVRASLEVQTVRLRASRGESSLVTTYSLLAESRAPRTLSATRSHSVSGKPSR